MNTHTMRTLGLLVIMFAIAGLKAVGAAPELTAYTGLIEMAGSVLLSFEHILSGNTSTN